MLVCKEWSYDTADGVHHMSYCYPSSYVIVKNYLNEGRQNGALHALSVTVKEASTTSLRPDKLKTFSAPAIDS
jgi:hypothetical protein